MLLDPMYNLIFSETSQCSLEGLTGADLLRLCTHFHAMNAAGTFILVGVQAGWGLFNSHKFGETQIPFLLSYTAQSSVHRQ